MSTTDKGERFAPAHAQSYSGSHIFGSRKAHSTTGLLLAGRRPVAELQAVADRLATITETATVGPREANGSYRVTFTVTHRILPIDTKEQNA